MKRTHKKTAQDAATSGAARVTKNPTYLVYHIFVICGKDFCYEGKNKSSSIQL